jgi:hypothetical protein
MKSVKIEFKAGDQDQILALITYLKKLEIVERIEEFDSKDSLVVQEKVPMTMDAFLNRIAEAEKDILEGKTFKTSEVRKMMNSWK